MIHCLLHSTAQFMIYTQLRRTILYNLSRQINFQKIGRNTHNRMFYFVIWQNLPKAAIRGRQPWSCMRIMPCHDGRKVSLQTGHRQVIPN